MKLKLLLIVTVLALCLTLAACGEQQTGGATSDTATADSADAVDNTAPANTSSSASPKEDPFGKPSPASSAVDSSPAPEANDDDNKNISHEADPPAQEEQPEVQQSSGSAASSKASSKASSAPSGNPAYDEDEKPTFTISMTDRKTKKTYSAACSYITDKEDIASVAFFLPGGEYDVAVYEYTEEKDKGEPLAEATYKNSIGEDKRKSVHVNYTPKDNKIEVVASTSSRNQ